MHWTDRQVELLILLWSEGKSPSQIASRLVVLGRDTVLDKIHLLMLGRSSHVRAAARHARILQAYRVSGRQHSHRFRMALAGRAERRARGDDGFSALETKTAWSGDRHARLFASLLALQEDSSAGDGHPSDALRPRHRRR